MCLEIGRTQLFEGTILEGTLVSGLLPCFTPILNHDARVEKDLCIGVISYCVLEVCSSLKGAEVRRADECKMRLCPTSLLQESHGL